VRSNLMSRRAAVEKLERLLHQRKSGAAVFLERR
jgi:hypothetical protein